MKSLIEHHGSNGGFGLISINDESSRSLEDEGLSITFDCSLFTYIELEIELFPLGLFPDAYAKKT